jgi:hypothetical protein
MYFLHLQPESVLACLVEVMTGGKCLMEAAATVERTLHSGSVRHAFA